MADTASAAHPELRQVLNKLYAQLDKTLRADRHRLRQRVQQQQRRLKENKPIDRSLEELIQAFEKSIHRKQWRHDHLPEPLFPEELPVSARREEIANTLSEHQVIVVAGETGSGKTTQLPKICLQAGRGTDGMIGCTQPRRLAARSIASRLAGELKTEVGNVVGYQVRFQDRLSENTYIKLMTDGILLAEMQRDRFLNAYDTIILDEAHERSLNIDFLLGYFKQLLPKRPDLKLIITSATIDTARFSEHFDNAPVINVEGRTYPVEVRYQPLNEEDVEDYDLRTGILDAVNEISRFEPMADILVFLSGERDIREVAESLRRRNLPQTEVLPLYARLSNADQDRVFKPGKLRRIVLSTNVAETSLTVPRIRAVIDPGFARVNRYSIRNKVQRLQIENISQASADQRKGRCGRIGPGICVRLYSEEDYQLRPEFTDPEILRSSLASVILRMLDSGLGDVEVFPFVEPPDSRQINDGFKLLEELGAVNKQRALTKTGRQLAKMPIDPRIARMILGANEFNCLTEVLIIAAALSIQDPRERPMDKQQAADTAHAQFTDPSSDFLAYLNLWAFYDVQRDRLSNKKLRQSCHENFLSYLRMREWRDIHQQLSEVVRAQGWKLNEQPADYEHIHRALLAGLLGNIGFQQERDQYLGARGIKWMVFPGSGLFKKAKKWVMAAELVDTTRLYARGVANIQSEWIEQAAGDLCRHSYSEAHWEKRPAQVAAYERVTVYGLPVVAKRRINYGPLDPVLSRQLFIRSALVDGEFRTRAAFFEHNRQLIEEVEELEHKSRRRDILIESHQLYEFYNENVPEGIFSGASFEKWYKQASNSNSQLLFLTRERLMQRDGDEITEDAFPERLIVQGVSLNVSYHFEPGHEADGMTVDVPVDVLNQFQPHHFDWLVPGLIKDKLVGLMRGLPKALRKRFVPIPDFAQAAKEALVAEDRPLIETLSAYLHRIGGEPVPPTSWDTDSLEPHLRMRFQILDEDSKTLGHGRDLTALQKQWEHEARERFNTLPKDEWEQDDLTDWTFGDLPEMVELTRQGLTFEAYPALVDKQGVVSLRLFNEASEAARYHQQGLRRLFLLSAAGLLKKARRQSPINQSMCLQYVAVDGPDALKDDFLATVADSVFLVEPWPTKRSEFDARQTLAQTELFKVAAAQAATLGKVLELHHEISKSLKSRISPVMLGVYKDIQLHLRSLVYPGFLRDINFEQLSHYPRYLKAAATRLERLENDPKKDARKAAEVEPLWEAWRQRYEQQREGGWIDPRVKEFRWLLEELRVSLFAQELKTTQAVSISKLEKMWKTIIR